MSDLLNIRALYHLTESLIKALEESVRIKIRLSSEDVSGFFESEETIKPTMRLVLKSLVSVLRY